MKFIESTGDPIKPQDICTHIHALDGYETYLIDENTIGVRPMWINVKDKLPEEYKLVLVNGDDGVFRAYRDNDAEYTSWQCSPIGSYAGDGCVFGITHWMPLPEKPNE